MVVGVLELSLFIPEAQSLKSKRHILKGLKEKVRRKFNVSIAETEHLDKWQRQTLAVACVNNNKQMVNSVLSQIENLVDALGNVELVDSAIEFR